MNSEQRIETPSKSELCHIVGLIHRFIAKRHRINIKLNRNRSHCHGFDMEGVEVVHLTSFPKNEFPHLNLISICFDFSSRISPPFFVPYPVHIPSQSIIANTHTHVSFNIVDIIFILFAKAELIRLLRADVYYSQSFTLLCFHSVGINFNSQHLPTPMMAGLNRLTFVETSPPTIKRSTKMLMDE